MAKRQNSLDATVIMSGLNYGEHGIDPNNMVAEIDRLCANNANCFTVRPNNTPLTDETFLSLAKYARDKQVYFGVVYAYQFPPKGKISHFNRELCAKIEDIAGKYFLGEFMGEAGSDKGAKARGYFLKNTDVLALQMPPQDFDDMQAAKDNFIKFIKKMSDYNKSIGMEKTLLVEATAFHRYNLEGGVQTPILEVMPGNPEALIAFTRGAAAGYKRKMWGGFIANEWYGGYRHEDELKAKRLKLAYNYLYMSGANIMLLESGNNELKSFGYDLKSDSPECVQYRKTLKDVFQFINSDKRPSCGPRTKVAFLHGNLDGYTNFMGSSVWSQFDKEEWGMSAPEYSWRILDEVYRARDWFDGANFGQDGNDVSAAPAYGMYDVLPTESDAEVLSGYDLLIFAGWNTMTDKIYSKLKCYVGGGGHLVICAAHLGTSSKRSERGNVSKIIGGGKLSEFLGLDITGEFRTNDGIKFYRDSERAEILYSGTSNFWCDCNYPGGYANYAKVSLTTAKTKAFFADAFWAPEDLNKVNPALTENRYGKGLVSVFTTLDYPGENGVYSLYKTVIKEYLTASHRACELKIYAPDKVRFSVFYEETGEEKLYLLNTDFSVAATITVEYKGETHSLTLPATQLTSLILNKKL